MSAPDYGGRSGAENVATVCACVDVIFSAIASLRAIVYERLPDGNRGDVRTIRSGGSFVSGTGSAVFRRSGALFHGQLLCFESTRFDVEHDGAGQPVALSAAALVERAADPGPCAAPRRWARWRRSAGWPSIR